MSVVELTINVDYLPGWKSWEGIRELIQNARDAEVMLGAKMTVTHHGSTSRLIICNDGCHLPHEALLLGTTSKAGKAQAIGQFGEGLKLGILALVREGHDITIRTGGEVWRPEIRQSAKFDARVLAFDIKKSDAAVYRDKVWIEIGKVEYEAWLKLKEMFTFLDEDRGAEDRVVTDKGDLLLDVARKGRIFVKGIFVKHHPKAAFGYDLKTVTLDRDRRMIGDFDLQLETAWIMHRAVAQRPDLFGIFNKILVENCTLEAKAYEDSSTYMAQSTPQAIKEQLVKEFVDTHGEGVLPCTTTEETQMVAQAGLRSVIVSKGLAALLTDALGTPTAAVQEHLRSVEKIIAWTELTMQEQTNWNTAMRLASMAEGSNQRGRCDVVIFRGGLLGLADGGKISIARGELRDVESCLATLLHEIAHDAGGDGDPRHVGRLEQLWIAVARELLKREDTAR